MISVNDLLPTITNLGVLSYWIIFLIALLESMPLIGLVIPGTIVLLFAGFLSKTGALDLGDLIWFAAAGGILGDAIAYTLGASERLQNRLLQKFPKRFVERSEQFIENHGGKSILFARFLAPVRPFVPYLSGMLGMKRLNFYVWNVVSGCVSAVVYLLLGWIFGQAWQTVLTWSSRLGFLFVIVCVSVLLLLLTRSFIGRSGTEIWRFTVSILKSLREAVETNPDVKQFTQNHPRLINFFQKRLSAKTFTGLPLSFLIVAIVYAIATLAGLVQDVIASDPIVAADIRIENLLYFFRSPRATEWFLWLTQLGNWKVIILWSFGVSLVLYLWHNKKFIFPLWVSLLGAEVLALMGKFIVARERPEGLAVYAEDSFSFPSGHATVAVVFWGFLAYLVWRTIRNRSVRLNMIFLSTVIILLIGFSRLYLGVHYLSDVLGGYLLGMIWLIIGISLCEWKGASKFQTTSKVHGSRFRVLTTAILLPVILLSLGYIFITTKPVVETIAQLESALPVIPTVDPLTGFSDETLSRYSEDLLGNTREPLSFLVLAKTDEDLIQTLGEAGWQKADPLTLSTITKVARAAFLNVGYSTAPMTPAFWNAQVNDFGFQKATQEDSIRKRHHARFWRTNMVTQGGFRVYVGTASFDSGLKWGVTHKIEPDIDTERDLLLSDLEATASTQLQQTVQFVHPILGENFIGDQFFTDGNLYLLLITSPE
ncbi:LssY C-terminal domain-containing protein [Candidatus Uhrbacteria bacterium]|nr:LssY C-terminal domain-containing protein [Candidatus Uhrbacteria bacterium]